MGQLRTYLLSVFFLMLGISLQASAEVKHDRYLERIRDKGALVCGVLPQVAGFSVVDAKGRYSGFEIDFCRAISAAILGNPDAVHYVIVRTVDEFKNNSNIDIVARRLTWTLRREAELGLLFSPVIFYDGAGFLVRRSSSLSHPSHLEGQPICVRKGSEAMRALIHYFSAADLKLVGLPSDTFAAASKAFFSNKCAALVADVSELAAERAAQIGEPDKFVILPKLISKEPLALVMRQGDEQFFLIVRWTVLLLIEAEELGLTSGNIDAAIESGDPRVKHVAGQNSAIGAALGLNGEWAANVIRGVGNYGEIYSRNLGKGSPIKLDRGPNDLWLSGGLMYAPPVR